MTHILKLMFSDQAIPLSPREAKKWCEKMIQQHSFKHDRIKELLCYLVGVGEKGTLIQDILNALYEGKGKRNTVTKLIGDLERKLEAYYTGAGETDRFSCTVKRSIGKTVERGIEKRKKRYQLIFHPRLVDTAPLEDAILTEQEHNNKVTCFLLGDDDAALDYEIAQMEKGYVHMFRDTHVRLSEEHREYKDDKLKKFQDGLQEFLNRAPDCKLMIVAGNRVEPKYVQSIENAAKGQESKVEWYKLQYTAPLMNFAILDYIGNRKSEVLFGWGRFDRMTTEMVFLSSHPDLVRHFQEFYKTLIDLSKKKAPDITDPSDPLKDTNENAIIIPVWSQKRIYDLLQSAKRNTEVRILTTLFTDWNEIRDLIVELIDRGVHVKIVMMELAANKKALFKARFERLRFHPELENAEDLLKKQLEFFETLCARQGSEGSIEVRPSGIMPFGFFVQCENEIVMGLLPPLSAYHQGPMIVVKSDSPLFKTLEKNWLGYWAYRSYSELEELEKRPDVEQVWLATPDLSNDSGKRPRFKETVKANAERGVKYTVIFPNHMKLEQLPELREFRELFPLNKATGQPLDLIEVPLNVSEFRRLMLNRIHTHIVIFNPHRKNNKPADVYIEMLDEQLWRKMDVEEANKTLNRFIKLLKR